MNITLRFDPKLSRPNTCRLTVRPEHVDLELRVRATDAAKDVVVYLRARQYGRSIPPPPRVPAIARESGETWRLEAVELDGLPRASYTLQGVPES